MDKEKMRRVDLVEEGLGYWSALVEPGEQERHYFYELSQGVFPDPASRFQPEGPHGPSRIIDPSKFVWSDAAWKGLRRDEQVIYELHVGTFTKEGNWASATASLKNLAELGVTVLEIMPVADFPGKFGWGYDGVNLFAPSRLYGEPDEFRKFVNEAHRLGLGVILDVVYNHFGPDGCYLREFSPHYFSDRYQNEWGEALNFDGEDSGPVREFFIANATYWIDEFHLDGYRFDATQQIFDSSSRHIVTELAAQARKAAGGKGIYLVAENEPQEASLVRDPGDGGSGLDSIWNDDFHHSAVVAMTGRNEAYYTDYLGNPQEFISSAKWGFLFQGQRYKWQKQRRGTPSLDLAPSNLVHYLQSHDQVANSLWGNRIHTLTSGARFRAFTALLLLGPNTPMLFQGQEFAASAPFLYFADHGSELAKLVAKGRSEFLAQFPSIASREAISHLPDPENVATFERCKLNHEERDANQLVWKLHRDLLKLRKADPILGKAKRGNYDGAVLGGAAFVLRFFGRNQDDRLIVFNFGSGLQLDPAPEPLLAPPLGCEWQIQWSSEDPAYGGGGTPPLESEENWQLPAESAVLLIPKSIP